MSKKSDRESKKSARRKTSAAATKKRPPRRTRMLALEPRMLFDGALGIDLGTKASAVLQGDASAAAETTAPAAPQAQAGAPTAPAAPEKSAVEKTAERLGLAPEAAPVRNEIVFVDSTVEGHQTLLAGMNPNAQVVMLDASRDALDQMADYMDGRRDVDAVHIISHGSAGNLILAGQTYSADRLSQQYEVDLARIGQALSADGDILLYGCDVGQGSAGERFIETVGQMTGADIAASIDKTGAADLGGDWVLEAKTGQVDAAIAISLTHEWDFLLTAPPVDVGGNTLDFNGANRTLESGTAGAAGAVYKYTDVATINGVQIDAYVTITGITNATLVNIDNDAPASYVPPAGTNAANVFAPEISVTAANGKIDFAINFKDPNGNNLTLLNFYNNSLDIDGAGGFQEFVEYGGFKSVTTGNPTDLVISSSPGNDRLRFTGSSVYNGLIVNDVGRVQANFDAISTLQISMGATGNTGGLRQYGSLFSAVSFGSPVTLTAPTSDLLTTADTTPILTGSVGAAPLGGGETFSVTVNGTTYTTANGLGISGSTWSLELPTALASGQYDVRAVRSSGALDIADQTQLELTINDAPTLADTALTLTVGEDAPLPTGAVGSPVSAFTGGISDVNPSAAKGIAIVGTVETNGTWYYTTNGGTTWAAVNQIDGAVSANNALLLADNANTRLYFRPNADFSGSAPGALTLRAWDTTSGTAGTKVDPGAGGGSLAFSTATDVIDVTVTPAADAPVNAVPGAQGTPISTSLEFSALNGNALSVADVDGNLSTARVTVTNGVVNVTLAGGATISAGANGSATLTISGTQAAINATLEGLRYTPTAGFTGTATLTLLSTDSSAQTDSDVVNITIAALATVPRIDLDAGSTNDTIADNLTSGGYAGSSGSVNLWTGSWVESDPEGAAQSAAAGDVRVTAGEIVLGDPGANNAAVQAIARGVDLSNHMSASLSFNYDRANLEAADTMVVEVSTNGGVTYTNLATYAGGTAVGLKTLSLAGYETDNTLIRFRLTTNFDATENVQIDNVVITAQPTGFTNTFTEGGAAVAIAQTDSAITDPNGGNLSGATIRIAGNYQSGADVLTFTNQLGITGAWNATTGTLTLTGNTTAANYSTAIEAIRFSNTSDTPSTAARTITVVVRDEVSGAASNTARTTITVAGANDAPVGVNDAATAIEAGGVANGTPGINPTGNVLANDTDPDAGDTKTVSAITGGTVGVAKAGSYGSVVINANGSYTYTLDNSNAAVQALRSAANTLYDTFTYTVRDTAGLTSTATLSITIQGANDTATIGTPTVAVVTEDVGVSGGNLTATGSIAITDVDEHQPIFSTTVIAVGGPLGALVLAADGTYTYTVSNAAVQSLGAGQTAIDTFTVTSADGTTRNVSFTINGANDAPVNAVPGAQAVNEDTALSIGGVSVSDVEGNLSTTRLTVTSGAVTVSLAGGATISAGANGSSTLTLSGTQAQINAALATISYQGGLNFNGAATLTVLSTDANGATDSDAVAITVNAVNDGPVNTVPAAQSVNEDTALAIGGVSVNDVDGNLATTRLTVTNGAVTVSLAGGATISAGANGTSTLTLSGTQAQINAALASISYQGNLNFNGGATLTVLSTDSNGATDSDAVAITVNAVNDGPVNTVPAAQSVNEDTALAIAGVSVNDVDGNLSTTRLTVTNGAVTVSLAGGATISAGANGSSTLTLSGTQAQINAALASISYQGNLNFNGGDTLTVLSTDGNGATDSDAVAITVSSVNDGPVNTVPGAQSVNEDTALSIAGVSVNDVDSNLSTTRLTVTNGAVTVSLAGGATISAGANGSTTLTLSGTQAQINAALASISYQGNLNFNGGDTLTVLSTDGNGATDSDAVAITVTSVNDGPVNTVPGAQSVNEDTALSIAGVSVNDVDSNLSTTRLTVTNGAVTVSLAGGATISAGANGSSTLTLSGTQAQINAALASISYQGNLNFNGGDTLTVLSTDGNGATDSDAVAITVSSVNDGPVNTVPGAQSVNEDTALSIGGVSVNDVDGNLSTTRLTVTNGAVTVSLAGGATISAGANGTSTLTLSGTQAQINAALASISYQGNLNFNGGATLTVLSTDASGGTDSDAVAITVTSVNDGPVNTVPGAQSVNEDTALSIGGVSVNDVDGNLSTTRLTVTSGAVTVSLAGGATISAGANGTSTLTLSGTQAQINAALASISYQGNLNFNGGDTLTVLSTDGNGATDSDAVAITVSSVNDGPVNTVPGAQSVNEDTALSIAGVSVNDVDSNLSTTRLTVTNGAVTVSLAGGATISAGANGSTTLTLSGTQAQINAALASISYQGNLNFNGGDTLTVLSTDGNGATDSDAVAITVTSVNDGPVHTVPGAQAVNEDTALTFTGGNTISVNDVDGNLSTTRLTVTNGAVTVSLAGGATISAGANGSSTLTLSGTQAQINAALASISYQGNLNFNGGDTLTVLSTDGNGATDSDAVAITVTSVNDGPVNTVPGAQTVNEDTALSISGVGVNDVDGNLSTTRLTVTNGAVTVSLAGGATISAGANGSSTLTLSGTQAQINAALASISYQGSLDFDGSDTLTVLSTDANGATDSDAVAITVNPVNDGPMNTVPGAQTVNEDTALSISGVSVNDVDGNLSTTQLTVTNGMLNVSLAGGATISSGANGSSTLSLSGTQAQINAALASLSYQGNLNFNGSDTLTLLSTDGNGVTDSDAVSITVSSVNDGPVNTVPGAQTVNEDTALSISGVSVSDVDGNLATTQLTVTSGALNVSLAGGATISAGANGSSTLTLSGTQAQINAALASLSYQGNLNFDGSDTLTLLSTDANGASDSDAVAITVDAVNDGPVNTVPGAQTVNEDTALSISGVSVNDVDGNLVTTQLTVTSGAVTVSLAGGATISSGANGSSTLTLSGTQAQINAALASLSYQGNLNFNGSDTLTLLSTDGNGVTDSDAVSITVSSVNDGPVNAVPGAQTVNEDTVLPISGVSVNDVDGNLSTTQLTVTNGALNVSLAGGATISAGANGSSTLTLSGTQAQINAALASINYQGNADFNGSDTLTVLSTDANGATDSDAVSITVNSVNDGPVNTVPGARTVNEDAALAFTGGNTISVNDVDGNLSTTQLTVTSGAVTVSLAGGATISAGASGSSTLTLSGTQAQINAALASVIYQGNANFNGSDTLTVLSTDGNGVADSDAIAITVSAVNDGPVNTVPATATVNEDAALTFIGASTISVNDVDGNLSTTQLTVTSGTVTVSLAGGATIGSGANGSSSLTLSGTQAQINAALASLSYQGNPNFNGSETLSVLSTDSNGATDSDSVAITVASVNDGPINTVPGAQTVNEDTALSIGVSVNDVDGNLSTTQLTVGNGAVTVSLAGGATIGAGANGSSTLTLSGTQAQINAALASLSYQGNSNFNGSDTLTVLSTDVNGATDSDTVAITVNSVNDGPVNVVPGAQTVNEDTSLSISGVSVNDVDGNLSTTQLTVANGAINVSLAGGATISAGANGSPSLTLSGTQAQINAALASISYQGNADFNGADTLTVLATDGNGVTDSDTVSITVSSVNDGPVNTVPGAQTVNEDTSLSISAVSVNDVDGNLSTTQLSVTNGAVTVSLAGGATISSGANGSSSLTLSGTQAQINAALASISYQGNADFNGSDTLTVLSTDGNGATDSDAVSITVSSVNDGPMNAVPGAQSVNEDTSLSIGGISVNDVDGNLATTQLTVANGVLNVSLAGGASISAGANGSSTLTLSGTQAQINAALGSLSYQGNLNFNGGDTLTVLSTDANGASDSDAVAITVSSVNDGPVNTVPGAQTVNEDTVLSIGGVSVNDVDGNLATTQLSVANGALNVSLAGGASISAGANGSSSLTLSGTQAQINAALGSLSYQGNSNFNGGDTLSVVSTDANGMADSDAIAITVTSVNDGPVNAVPGAQAVNEDTVLAIGGISVNDVDGNLSTTQLSVTSGVLNVSLAGGATISAGANGSSSLTLSGTQAQINAALASLSYQGNADFNGGDTLTVLSTDANGAMDSDAVAITVSSVNDGPMNTVPGAQTVNEDTVLAIGGISVNDVDGNLSTTQLTVTNGVLNVSLAGGASISAGANGSSSLTLSGTQAQINAALGSLSYQGNSNFNGGDTLTVLSTDSNGATDSDGVAIAVTSVNDGPVNAVPGAQTVNEDTVLAIGGISVNDVDGNLSTTQLSVTSGVLNVSLAGGATISAGANGSSTLTLSGTQAQINAALASVSYQGNADFNGGDTLTVLSSDANGATDSDSVAITVSSVNDGPVNTVPGAQAVNEDTVLSIGGVSVNDVDGNLATTELTVANGLLNVSLAGGATISAGANGSSALTLSGTQAQINAALASLSYQGNADFNGGDTLTLLSTDANGATDSDAVAITVNSVNDGPVNAVPGAQAVNEDTVLPIGGVSVNDVDGNLSTTQLSVGNGVLNVSLAGGAAISAGANGSSTLTLSGTQAQINAALASISYQGSADFNGSDTLTVLSTDGNGVTDSDAVSITVSSVNDGPVNTVPGAQAVNEDAVLSIGGVSVNDVDGNLSTTQLTVTSGVVNVSLAGGATISAGANGSSTLTLSGTQAQINAALASLSYQANADFNGGDTLTVVSTDANGAADSDAIAISVNSVNDGPINTTPGAQTVNEDTVLPIGGISVNDVDGNLSSTQLSVANGVLNVSLAGGATISAGANGSSSLTLSGTQAQINAALASLSYQGNADFNGGETLTVLSTDANGVTDSDAIAITVTSVNDGPLNAVPGAQAVNEDTVLPIGGVSVNDVDGNLATTQVSVGNGTLNVSLAGGATISAGANGSSSLTLSGTQAQINAALASISYQGNANFNGADTLTVLSSDSNGVTDSDTVAITVNSVNDGPLNAVPGAQTVTEDTVLAIGGLSVNDVDGNLSTTQLTVSNGVLNVSLAGGATISAGANGSSTVTLSGMQAQINAALASLSYQGNADFNGGDTLTVVSTDANGATDSDAVSITVSSVNDGPMNSVPGAQTIDEDTATPVAGVSVNDVDGNLSTTQLTVTNGTVTVSLAGGATLSAGANGSSTLTLSGTQAQINAALASLSYQGNLSFNGSDTLTVLSTDANGATDSDAVAINVTPVNNAPVNTVPGAQTVNEDTVLSISGVSVSDVEGNLSTTQLTVANGTLNVSLAGGATISAGANGSSALTLSGTQAQINAALASIAYQGNANFNGSDTLTVVSTDGVGEADSDTVSITVSSINDGPVNAVPGAQTVNEDTALAIGINVNDVDGNLSTTQVTVTNGALNVSLAGGATISAGANGSSSLTLSGTQAQINAALASLSYQGNLNFSGSDTLSVLSTDGNGVTDSDTVSITVNAVNDGPVNIVPGAQTVNEDTTLSISGISVNDVEGNLSTTQLTVTNGALGVSLAGGATISAGANGSSSLTLSGTQAQINAALASLSYQGNPDFNGSDTLTVVSTDANGATDSDAVSITVTSVNDGPVNTVAGAQTVNEDTSLSIGLSVNDVDGNLSTTQLSVSSGTLNVSLAGGATISAGANGSSTLTLSGTQAQINAALASLAYQGNLDFNGSDTLTVLSTDANGATDSDAVSITVSSVNDGPMNTVPGAQTVNEDTSLSISGVSVNDVDGNLSTTQLTVTSGTLNVSLAGGATISSGANGSASLTLSGTQAQINAALASISYQGNANFNGFDTLTVLSTDGNGVADSDAVSITVSSVNDGPVNTVPGAQTVNEDTSLSISGVSVNDVDGNLSTTQLTVTNGTLNVSLAGGATISSGANGSASLTLSGTQAQINAALASISYQGNAEFNGSDTLTLLSTDANGATDSDAVAITVSSVNDGPVNAVPGAQTVNEDTALSISGVSVNDVDGNLSSTQLSVTNGALNVSLAGGATISAGANGSSSLTLSGTQAQINAALASISYQGNAEFNGSDTLTVLSTDANGTTDSDAVAITVNSVNDGPVNTVPGAQGVNEDTALSIGGVSVNDVDGNLSTTQLSVTNGALNVSLAGGATISAGANGSSSLTLSGTQAQINAALASLSYQGNPDFNGADTLTVLSTDGNGVTDSDAVSITVSSVNDGPVNTVPGAQSVNEDTALSISGVSVNDVDGNLSTTRLTVTNGTLNVSLAGGATVSAGANGSSSLTLSGTLAQINAALASISYQGNPDFTGADTLTVLSTDANGAADSDAVAITLSSVNDGPMNAVPGAQTVNEDSTLSIGGVSVNDVDGNLSTTQLSVTNGTLNVSLAGGAAISAGANGSSTLTLSGTQAQINAALASISYQANADFSGADALTVLSTDANGATDSDAVAITVTAVNDGPVNTVPGAQAVSEDTALAIAGVSVNDVDGNLSTTQLSVTNGTLNVSLAGGATISAGANGSSSLTLSGTQAQINAALASISYQGNADFNGSDTLTVLSTDGNGLTDADAVAITVGSVNDGPVNALPGAQSVNEDTVLPIGGLSVNDIDGNLSTTQLTVTNGAINVSLAGGASLSAGANGSATLTLSGTQVQINAALASLSYQASPDFNGADTLTVLSTDANGATDSDAVTITVSSVNDGPMNGVPGAQTVNEDAVLPIGGLSVNDVDGNLSTTQLSVTNGTLNVSLAGGAAISAGANGSSTLTLSGTQAQINAALASISYQGNPSYNGTDTLTMLSTDGNGATDSDTVSITVTGVNDTPVNTVPGAQTVNEDTSLSISGVSVSDTDGNLSTTQLTVTNGSLNVSLAGGASISAGANGSSTLTLSGTQAQINAALASISYQGNPDFDGSDTLTVLSTDANGATDSDAVSITVSSVNDGPVNAVPGAQTVNEDTALSISGVSVNDVDGNLSTTQLTVTNGTLNVSLAGGAAISAGANNTSTLTLSGTQAQINAALASLSYQGDLDFSGADTLSVLSTDGNGLTDSDTVSITVSSVNDGPVNTVPGAQTVNEDTALSIGGVSVNDVDGNLSTTQLTVTNGTLNVSLAGGATISAGANGSSTLTLSGTQAQINAALASISYQGNADFSGAETLTVLSTDANGATDSDAVSVSVSSVNDGPVNAVPGAQTVNEDTALSIAGVSVNDVDGNLSNTQLTVTNGAINVSLAGGATISAGANGSSTLTLSGTQAQINAALASISYQGNANFNGSDTLTVLSTDGNGVTDSDAVSITVSSVNDGPVNTVPAAQTVNEDTALSISGVSVNDVDGNLSTTRLTVTSGALNVSLAGGATISAGANGSSTLTLSGTQAQINAALASISYQGNANFSGSDTLTVLSTDANGATDSDAVAITVSSVNDGPVNTVPGAQTVNEDTALPIGGVSVTDVDGNLSTTRLTVTSGSVTVSLAGGATISAGANGSSTLTLSGTQAQINAALASLSYQGNADFNGADTLTVLSTDANGSTDSDAVSITVSSVNDGPVNTVPGAQTVNEDTALPIGGISVNDADGNLSTTRLTVAIGALNVSLAGGATISAGANGSSTLTLSGTQAQINAALASLSYQGNANFNGSDTLTVLSTDGNGVTDSDAVSITVSSVNDGPVNIVPGAQTVSEDSALSIAGVSVSDVDGNLSTTRLTVASGTLNVSLAGGATISAGANGSSSLTLSGTQAQINAALASISYQGNANVAGSDTLTVLSTDANGATDSDAISITVTAVNDAPAVTSAATATFVENATGAVYTATRSEVDGGDTATWTLSGADAALFTIDPVTGVVSLTGAQDFDTPGDANGDGIYEITVRATDSGGLFDQRNVQLTLTAMPEVPASQNPEANPMAGQSAPPPLPTAPASQPPLPGFAPPRGPQFADGPLGLPVDVATPASNLGSARGPGAASPAAPDIADLNALPPTGAGPAATFGVVRLSVLEAGSHLRLTGATLQHDAGGHHLFVYHGVPSMRLFVDGSAVLGVPADAFAHTDPAARVYLEARLASGAPLPGWLKFDGLRGLFSGTPPEGVDGILEIEVVARDTEGREARTKFTLEIEELRAQAAAAGLALGLDVDKEEAEKVRQELARQAHNAHLAEQAKAATAGVRPSKPGAASFSDQVSAAKTQRDPLLERINPSGKDKTGSRR